jgi:hypothetical protein
MISDRPGIGCGCAGSPSIQNICMIQSYILILVAGS